MRSKFILLILIVLFPLLLSGCSAADEEMLNAFVLDFIVNNAGKIGVRKIFGSSGDDWVDAALDIKDIIDRLNEPDRLMDAGRKNKDPDLMDQAIEQWPDNPDFRTYRASLALEQGDVTEFGRQRDAANNLIEGGSAAEQEAGLDTAIQEFEQAEDRIGREGFQSGAQCSELYGQLSALYGQRAALTGSADDTARATGYANQANYCQ